MAVGFSSLLDPWGTAKGKVPQSSAFKTRAYPRGRREAGCVVCMEGLAADPALSPPRALSASSAGDPQGHCQSNKLSCSHTSVLAFSPKYISTSPQQEFSDTRCRRGDAGVEPRMELGGWRQAGGCGWKPSWPSPSRPSLGRFKGS